MCQLLGFPLSPVLLEAGPLPVKYPNESTDNIESQQGIGELQHPLGQKPKLTKETFCRKSCPTVRYAFPLPNHEQTHTI